MARVLALGFILFSCILLLLYALNHRVAEGSPDPSPVALLSLPAPDSLWHGPDSSHIPNTAEGALIYYGRELIVRTSGYYGPNGKLSRTTNGMNCQNCHLEGGTKPWGNNYGAVFSTYPKFRPRRGAIETIQQKINDCFSRSLNGMPIDTGSREMKAIVAYLQWLGRDVPRGAAPRGTGILQPSLMNRPADSSRGRIVYAEKCQRCHGPNGQGNYFPGTVSYQYPPLWGLHSYNTGAGMYRLSRLAGYVKNNMPFGTDYTKPQLTDEEAWDVAAFVNSRPRPVRAYREDWPDISRKPFDHPYGPYADKFSEAQHKFGPFPPIQQALEAMTAKKTARSGKIKIPGP